MTSDVVRRASYVLSLGDSWFARVGVLLPRERMMLVTVDWSQQFKYEHCCASSIALNRHHHGRG
jgi:hypothetical protein